jgi:hypothetical protein
MVHILPGLYNLDLEDKSILVTVRNATNTEVYYDNSGTPESMPKDKFVRCAIAIRPADVYGDASLASVAMSNDAQIVNDDVKAEIANNIDIAPAKADEQNIRNDIDANKQVDVFAVYKKITATAMNANDITTISIATLLNSKLATKPMLLRNIQIDINIDLDALAKSLQLLGQNTHEIVDNIMNNALIKEHIKLVALQSLIGKITDRMHITLNNALNITQKQDQQLKFKV